MSITGNYVVVAFVRGTDADGKEFIDVQLCAGPFPSGQAGAAAWAREHVAEGIPWAVTPLIEPWSAAPSPGRRRES